jgi:cytidylate kinase
MSPQITNRKGVRTIQITIDGPAGAGKSTVARAVANELNYIYIDTGAMYRAVAWLALKNNIDLNDEAALTSLAQKANISFCRSRRGQQVFCNGQDVTRAIREPKITRIVSQVSAVAGVRDALVRAQRQMAEGQNVVMDGRDAGTVILPEAQCKIFLTASVEERARRRMRQQQRLGLKQDLESLIADMVKRDYQDTNRSVSPLKPAQDAVILDCTDMDFPQTVKRVLDIVQQKVQQVD